MNYNDILEKMLNGEIKPYQLDKMFNSKIATEIRRKFIEKKVGIEFKHICNYSIEEEMAMVKFDLKQVKDNLADIDALARCYNGKISNVNDKNVVVSVVDRPSRIDNFLKAIQAKYKNVEIVRSGVSVIER